MEYEAAGKRLARVGTILEGEANEVYICQNRAVLEKERYLLWELKDRGIARYLLEQDNQRSQALSSLQKEREQAPSPIMPFEEVFLCGDRVCFLFPYEEPRPLLRYAVLLQPWEKERVPVQLFALCMGAALPWPLLYMLLASKNVNVRKDGCVYFTYELDLAELDPDKTEKDCVSVFIVLLLKAMESCTVKFFQWSMLWGRNKNEESIHRHRYKEKQERNRRRLLEKKAARGQYETLLEVYQDFRAPVVRKKRLQLSPKAKKWLYRLAIWTAVICIVLAAGAVISSVFFRDMPLLRVFSNTFDKIGTQNLGR